MNVFFEKIFKSFPDRQNFKIFPQRACKHLQNTKKYVIINKLISITIKNGLMVKRLRRCPLTAESAVRFRMGLPKKETTPPVVLFLFFSTPLRRNDAATCLPSFVNLRKQILAVGSHRPHFCFPVGYIWETATSAWGYILLRCVKRRGNLLPSFLFASANYAVVLRFTEVGKIRKGMQTETATSAWGYTTSLRRKNSATSYFIRKKIFPIEYYLKISRKVIKPT